MKKLSIALFIFLSNLVHSQVKINDILSRYKNDKRYEVIDSVVQSIRNLNYKIPLVDEINLRSETDRNNLARQEYALRVEFNGFKESKLFGQQKSILQSQYEVERNKIERELLYESYKKLIDAYYLKKAMPIFDSLEVLYKKRLNLLVMQLSNGEYVSPKDIIKQEEEIYKIQQDRKQTNLRYYSILQSLNISEIQFSNWPDVNEVMTHLASLNYNGESKQLKLSNDIALEKSRLKYQLDLNRDKRILDFAQLRYSKRDNLLFQDEFSFGIGLRLPYRGSSIVSKNEYLIKDQDLKFEAGLKRESNLLKFSKLMNEIKVLAEEIDFYNTSLNSIFKTLNENVQIVSVEIQQAKKLLQFENYSKQLEIEQKFFEQYLEVLSLTELINSYPKRNYLEKGQPLIE